MPICILSCLSVAAAFSGSVFVFDMEVSLSILCVEVQTCKKCRISVCFWCRKVTLYCVSRYWSADMQAVFGQWIVFSLWSVFSLLWNGFHNLTYLTYVSIIFNWWVAQGCLPPNFRCLNVSVIIVRFYSWCFQQGEAATTSSKIVKHCLHVCGLRDIHGTSISSLMYCKYKYYLFCAAELLVAHIERCPPGPHSEQSTHIMRILFTH